MSQKERILEILKDCQPHSTFEIVETLFPGGMAGIFRLGARVWDIQKEGYVINGWHDPNDRRKYWYQIIATPEDIRTYLTCES